MDRLRELDILAAAGDRVDRDVAGDAVGTGLEPLPEAAVTQRRDLFGLGVYGGGHKLPQLVLGSQRPQRPDLAAAHRLGGDGIHDGDVGDLAVFDHLHLGREVAGGDPFRPGGGVGAGVEEGAGEELDDEVDEEEDGRRSKAEETFQVGLAVFGEGLKAEQQPQDTVGRQYGDQVPPEGGVVEVDGRGRVVIVPGGEEEGDADGQQHPQDFAFCHGYLLSGQAGSPVRLSLS